MSTTITEAAAVVAEAFPGATFADVAYPGGAGTRTVPHPRRRGLAAAVVGLAAAAGSFGLTSAASAAGRPRTAVVAGDFYRADIKPDGRIVHEHREAVRAFVTVTAADGRTWTFRTDRRGHWSGRVPAGLVVDIAAVTAPGDGDCFGLGTYNVWTYAAGSVDLEALEACY